MNRIGGIVAPSAMPAAASERVREAARQFESLLMEQLLRGMRTGSAGWLGTGEDAAGDVAMEYAEQQFAEAIASRGGLGLAELIASGLEPAQVVERRGAVTDR